MNESHNPDVLSCLANLSNDEVFTPPKVVNDMLDLLPPELFKSKDTTFLDIGCKSGVFLREIAKRLIAGLEHKIPDLQSRVDHILHQQLFGIATTELTSLVSRRTLYCSKYPNCIYSASRFDNPEGNIRFRNIPHDFVNGRCKWCGASEDQFGSSARQGLETHAYEFIHTSNPEKIFNMKFDVIVGNPPYQLTTGGSKAQATPIYDRFVTQAIKLNPRYLTMIIPSRWFAGGMGLDEFRNSMMSDPRMARLVDYANAKDCFPGTSIGGGVCYFLWRRDHKGACEVVNVAKDSVRCDRRKLDEFPVLVRYNKAVEILRKVDFKNNSLSSIVSSICPFGLTTKARGLDKPTSKSHITMYHSGGIGYLSDDQVEKGLDLLKTYKVMVSQTSAEHAGEPSQDGKFRVLTTTMRVLGPDEVCTHSYLVVGSLKNKRQAENLKDYLRTFFVRFLLLQSLTSIHLTKSTFVFVPLQDFSKPWTDAELYKKYKLTKDEIAFIESMIKPME